MVEREIMERKLVVEHISECCFEERPEKWRMMSTRERLV